MTLPIQHARSLLRQGNVEEAYAVLQNARRDNPLDEALWYEQAKLFETIGRFDLAERQLAMYVQMNRRSPTPFMRLGQARLKLGLRGPAVEAYQACVSAHGDYAPALAMLGVLAFQAGRMDDGRAFYERVVRARPIDPESEASIGMVRLTRGELAEGFLGLTKFWDVYDRDSLPPWRADEQNLWTGTPLDGRPLIVHGENGLGDQMLVLRFVPRLESFGGPIFLSLPSPLRRLARQLPNVAVLDSEDDAPAGAMHVGLMYVPAALGIRSTKEDVAGTIPYFRGAVARNQTSVDGPVRVGLTWKGAPGGLHDHDRSVAHFSMLAPLLTIEGVTWQSLQFGEAEQEIDSPLVKRLGEVSDFQDTADLIESLDLVVTVDTAVANLAGAMGKPVFDMIPTVPDIRWGIDEPQSIWYPSIRLFRRPRSDAWPAVIDDVRVAIDAFVRATRSFAAS